VRSTSLEKLGLELRFKYAIVIITEKLILDLHDLENHNMLYLPIKKPDEPLFVLHQNFFIAFFEFIHHLVDGKNHFGTSPQRIGY